VFSIKINFNHTLLRTMRATSRNKRNKRSDPFSLLSCLVKRVRNPNNYKLKNFYL